MSDNWSAKSQREEIPKSFFGRLWYLLKQNKIVLVGVSTATLIILLLILLIFNPIVIVRAGQRGVVMNWGAVQSRVLGEGLHFIAPIYQSVYKADVRVQKAETPADASSKDLQDAHSTIAVNYHIDPDRAWWVYQNIGKEYKERIIDPQVQEIFKAVTAKFTAVELITLREKVRNETKNLLKTRFLEYGLIVDDISIVNFKFSGEFTKAIEAKQTAEQLALKAKNDLERIKIEADQKVASAKAEAESLRLQKEQVTDKLVELRKIEVQSKAIDKWDGKLPYYTGGGVVPFIDVKK